ncbi:MAG: exosome complex RNA-binding protein Csl4 [Nitrososphaerota archaeon]|nr:exosome complex RNA-binding protein Csl4 [Nitrososphaerota archaeon]
MSEDKRQSRVALPGDKLATIEEFVSGEGSASFGEFVASTVTGKVEPDMTNRMMNVKFAKTDLQKLPRAGDYIIGTVQSAQPAAAQINMVAVNDTPSHKEFTGMLSLRDDRRRRSTPIKPGDTIRALIFSTKNAIFHLTLDAPNCGVLYTTCVNCGGSVVALGRDRVKCRECGWVDERLLAEDFIKFSRSQANP